MNRKNCIRHCVQAARAKDDMSGVRHIGADETSVKRRHAYITVLHDLQAKRLLFACPENDHKTLEAFAKDLRAHGGDPERVEHACIDMSAAYTKGIARSLPKAQISYDRFHVIALANAAMDEVRREEMLTGRIIGSTATTSIRNTHLPSCRISWRSRKPTRARRHRSSRFRPTEAFALGSLLNGMAAVQGIRFARQ